MVCEPVLNDDVKEISAPPEYCTLVVPVAVCDALSPFVRPIVPWMSPSRVINTEVSVPSAGLKSGKTTLPFSSVACMVMFVTAGEVPLLYVIVLALALAAIRNNATPAIRAAFKKRLIVIICCLLSKPRPEAVLTRRADQKNILR
jgi:hypothetical protein